MSLPVPLAQGTTIGGHYTVGPRINSGGFGAIYRGVDTSEGNRACAIKEIYDVTPAVRRQALMEASVLFTVRSNHFPEVYDAFEANGRFYLVMQLIEGQNLLQLLRSRVGGGRVGEQQPSQQSRGPCSEHEVLSWLLPIMEVLQELHSRNPAVIHRDIKPANIILTPMQTTVLVDFGITKLYDPNRDTQTMVKAVSEGFSPIEQYVGRTSPQSDLYSMAATMYLLLTNRLPPSAMSRSMQDSLIAPRLLNPALTPKIERVLLKALAVNADQRYQSMREFSEALQEPGFNAFSDQTIAGPPVRATSKGATAPTLAASPPPPPPPVRPQTKPVPAIKQTPPLYAYKSVPDSKSGVPRQSSVPGGRVPLLPYGSPAPGYIMVPQVPASPTRPLPGASRQGCLWGMLQGVLSALLIFFLLKDVYFFLGILMGFVFYVLAGFITTHRGGPSLRGAWAGFWAGIFSTIMFWIVLLVSLVGRWAQRLQAQTTSASQHGFRLSSSTPARIWRSGLPEFLTYPSAASQQQNSTNLLILLAGGLLIAFSLGWIGGLMGRSWYKAGAAKKMQP